MPAAFETGGQAWEIVALEVDHCVKGGHENEVVRDLETEETGRDYVRTCQSSSGRRRARRGDLEVIRVTLWLQCGCGARRGAGDEVPSYS
jgi:hypothetical protein